MNTNTNEAQHYTILRPSRGPTDEQIEYALSVMQGGIAVFHRVFSNPLFKLNKPPAVYGEA